MSQSLNSAVAVIGIDIGKNSFHIVGLDERGAIRLRQKWSRGQVDARLANMAPCLIGMEACVGAHHLSRKLKALGHDARLMPAKYVRPYSKGQKNDFRDAEAIAEAVQRPTMKFVATKTAEQLDLQALHRVRERLVSQRTGIINQIRAFLLERGVAVRQGQRFLRAELPRILATPPDVLSPRMVRLIEDLAGDWRRLDERVESSIGRDRRMIDVYHRLATAIPRTITWLHMPVPRDRVDDPYFSPLRNLKLKSGTELYLGLIHLTDGVEGAKRRAAAAKRFVSDFGVATECGFGRRPPETIPDLIRLHRMVAQQV